MRVVRVFVLFTLACSAQFLAVEVRADNVSATVRAEITALVEAWIDAEVASDADALESLLHEDFLSTFSSGATLDRAA